MLCSYDANGLPDPVLDGVWRTHPEVVARGAWSASERFDDPDALLRGSRRAGAARRASRSVGVGADVEAFRERLAAELSPTASRRRGSLDMLLAATEILANALEHGGGVRDVRVGRVDGRFVCEVVDAGAGFDDPTAGYPGAPRRASAPVSGSPAS